MKNIRIYLLALCALALSTGSILVGGSSASTTAAPDKDVVVVNTSSNPVPVTAQGTTNIAGTVSVSNFPGSIAVSNFPSLQPVTVTNFPNTQPVTISNFPETQAVSVSNFPNEQAVTPVGTPITLRNYSGIYNGDLHRMGLTTEGLGGAGATPLSGQLAIGSITVTALSLDNHKPEIDLLATDCAGNDLERIGMVQLVEGSTVHLDFPTPQLTPSDGPRQRFCIAAVIFNDHHDSGAEAPFNVTVVGNMR